MCGEIDAVEHVRSAANNSPNYGRDMIYFLLRGAVRRQLCWKNRANKISWYEGSIIFKILRIISWRDGQPAEVFQYHKKASSTAWLDRSMGKSTGLETHPSTFSALVGIISTSALGMCWYSLVGHLARLVHSHHECVRLRCFILRNYV
jgi:hypothetical protein